MAIWNVASTDEFDDWWDSLTDDEQDSVSASVGLIETVGPQLGRPHVDTVKKSRHSNMKELRVQHRGRPIRVFFAFDPRRTAVLLIGGDKTGDNRFYHRMISQADRLFDDHLREIESEGDVSHG